MSIHLSPTPRLDSVQGLWEEPLGMSPGVGRAVLRGLISAAREAGMGWAMERLTDGGC